jgi:hypothetical protein
MTPQLHAVMNYITGTPSINEWQYKNSFPCQLIVNSINKMYISKHVYQKDIYRNDVYRNDVYPKDVYQKDVYWKDVIEKNVYQRKNL